MYNQKIVSPLDLMLDSQNPRFIITETGNTQNNIREYLISQENVLILAKSIAENGGLMPGERIVVCIEDGSLIVLEGNRRTCTCQMFLNRDFIPEEYTSRFPQTTDALKSALNRIEIDIITSRTEARRFLAVRHIERTKEWSTIAKMRFCFEEYKLGKTVAQIRENTGISISNINKYIRHYKILMRGLNNSWSEKEKGELNLLKLEPDKLLRLFTLSDTKSELRLYFDSNHVLKSNQLSDVDLDTILFIWTKKAFVEKEIDTRTQFGKYWPNGRSTGACKYIESILQKYIVQDIDGALNTGNGTSRVADNMPPTCGTKSDGGTTTTPSGRDVTNGGYETPLTSCGSIGRDSSTTSGISTNPRFFAALNYSSVDPLQHNGKGVIAVCEELINISESTTFINKYPICTAFIIRALIEQSIKYHAKANCHWADIMQVYRLKGNTNGDPPLSFIINQYKSQSGNWITNQSIRRLFGVVFTDRVQGEKFNLVVHSPELYTLSRETLKAIPDEGLLAITNYLLGN